MREGDDLAGGKSRLGVMKRCKDIISPVDLLIDSCHVTKVSSAVSKAEHWGMTRAHTLHAPVVDVGLITVFGSRDFEVAIE